MKISILVLCLAISVLAQSVKSEKGQDKKVVYKKNSYSNFEKIPKRDAYSFSDSKIKVSGSLTAKYTF